MTRIPNDNPGGLDYTKDNVYDALGRPDLKPVEKVDGLKEIRERYKELERYSFETKHDDLNEEVHLFTHIKEDFFFLLSEVERLQKENDILKKVAKAAEIMFENSKVDDFGSGTKEELNAALTEAKGIV